MIGSNVYGAYPRQDGYVFDTGYNVSKTDINVAAYIHGHALQKGNQDYIVLANQSVSAAALQKYGFYRYVNDNTNSYFYYPIPTSSLLYKSYITITENPNIDTLKNLAETLDISTIYLVINSYWANSSDIITRLKQLTPLWTSIDEGTSYIFIFENLK
jgi:hypothetical protein